MKKQSLFILLAIFFSCTCFATGKDNKDLKSKDSEKNSKIISGKVVDSKTKEEIAGAEINIAGQKIYTDLSGNFSIAIPNNTSEAVVKYVSYENSTIKFSPYTYSDLVIEITPQ